MSWLDTISPLAALVPAKSDWVLSPAFKSAVVPAASVYVKSVLAGSTLYAVAADVVPSDFVYVYVVVAVAALTSRELLLYLPPNVTSVSAACAPANAKMPASENAVKAKGFFMFFPLI